MFIVIDAVGSDIRVRYVHSNVIYHDCPSGLSELRPARSISSVDSKFTAMTELRAHMSTTRVNGQRFGWTHQEFNICRFTL